MKKIIALILSIMLLSAAFCEGISYPLTVTDAAGREVTIEECAETVVSGYYISTSALLALGLEDKLIGIEAKADSRNIYALSAPEVISLPCVGSAKQFDLETAVSLGADVMFLPLKLKSELETLEEFGTTVIFVAPESIDDMFAMLDTIALVCGADSQPIKDFYADKFERISAFTENDAKPSVYLAGNSAYLRTAGKGMYQDSMISLGGGINVAADLEGSDWCDISYEQLIAYDPDVIVIASDAEYTPDDILADAMLSEVSAIKNGQVYALPSEIESWDSPVPSAILGSLYVASILYPDSYTHDEFVSDACEFYSEFYAFDASELIK